MKKFLQIGLAVLGSSSFLLGQQFKDIAPERPPGRAPATQIPAPASAEEAAKVSLDDAVIAPQLKGLVIAGSTNGFNSDGLEGITGLKVRGPDFLKKESFKKVVAPFLGRPVSNTRIRQLQRDIIFYCREQDHPIIDAWYPPQEVKDGILQMVVFVGKLGKVSVDNPGKKWFSDEFVQRNVRLQPGEPVRESKLLEDVNWLNRNPFFRDVNVNFKQGELGATDLDLKVQDRFPLRVYGGVDDTGNLIVGDYRVFGGFNWGNAFGLDHQLNYQYTRDIDFKFFQAHSASYIVPLPWRHAITLFGSYSDLHADLASLGFAPLEQDGTSYQASIRYTVPLPKIKRFNHELSAGFDYKGSDFRVQFDRKPVFNTPTEIGQAVLAYRALLPDGLGSTSFGAEGYYSPGGMFPDNTDANFTRTRPGASADYIYGRFDVERGTKLPFTSDWKRKALDECFAWVVRGTLQISDGNLLPSEQLGIGGYSTVRGYDERLGNGDEGWVINNEIRTPAYRLGNLLGLQTILATNSVSTLQFLGFFDYGAVQLVDPTPGFDPHVNLVSVGAGLRMNVARNFALRFDYGFQLTEKELSQQIGRDTSRGHFSAVLSF